MYTRVAKIDGKWDFNNYAKMRRLKILFLILNNRFQMKT